MLAADAHKWLLGPCGAGILCVRREVQDRINPPIHGWHNVNCPDFVAQEQIEFRKDARKYEAGTHNLLGVVGLMASIELLLDVGIENISTELLRKRSWLVPALQAKGYTVFNADSTPETASGIVTFHKAGQDMVALSDKLAAANIVASLRTDRKKQHYIRLAPHFYNTDAELQKVLELL
jgi:selenocysteine lyase/cysteine desulfurase